MNQNKTSKQSCVSDCVIDCVSQIENPNDCANQIENLNGSQIDCVNQIENPNENQNAFESLLAKVSTLDQPPSHTLHSCE